MKEIDFMKQALREAEFALEQDEVPVGAVIVQGNKIIASGHNNREREQNALGHAEICAIQQACARLKRWRLSDCTIYVTLEPCPMCAGAILQAKMKRVVFGAYDDKFGAVGSKFNLFYDQRFNHQVLFTGGVLEAECVQLLRNYFEQKREKDVKQETEF